MPHVLQARVASRPLPSSPQAPEPPAPSPRAPLFIVGNPRSGTKLLRDLLNRHPSIALFPRESHCFPFFARRAGRYGDLLERRAFNAFHAEFRQTTFHARMAKAGYRFEEEAWFAQLEGGSYRDALTALFTYYAQMTGKPIVGDKTPAYLNQVPLLSGLFPGARFIHIVRDPRDCSESMHRVWGKNMLRGVQRWKDQVRRFRRDAAACQVNCLELRYEDLLERPAETLERVCAFVGVAFDPAMLTLAKPAERRGEARALTIVGSNAGKWRKRLGAAQVEAIERIAGKLMQELGYPPATQPGDEDLGPLRMAFYRLQDGWSLFRYRLRDYGLTAAIRLSWSASRHSGNR
jgi:hypothetical protein